MPKLWTPEAFEATTASRETWQAYHVFRRARAAERDPSEPISPDAVVEAQMCKPSLEYWQRRAIVMDGGRILGFCSVGGVEPDTEDFEANGHLMFCNAGVLGPWRRLGIGRSLLRFALRQMDRAGARVLLCDAEEADGQACLDHIGAKVVQESRYSRLDWQAIDWARVDRWIAEGERRAPEVRLELHDGRMPESLWPEACAARTELMRLIPRDDMDMGDWTMDAEDQQEMYERMDIDRSDHHVVFARDASGGIIGITDVAWSPDKTAWIYQYFTGVHPKARGKGVGKRLKAAMLRHLEARYPEAGLRWMTTDNANSNAPMLSINERLGFREHKVAKVYQIERSALDGFA